MPKSPFKYKKRSMTQLWWGYHEASPQPHSHSQALLVCCSFGTVPLWHFPAPSGPQQTRLGSSATVPQHPTCCARWRVLPSPQRTFAFPVRTQRRLLFLLHCLRQARFPLAEVKVSIKHRTAVYASHQEGPFGNAKVKRVEGKASLGQEPPVAEKEVVEREAATAM